jgi:hypothetical protein
MRKRQKPQWLRGLPIDPSQLTLDEARSFKEADRYLTEPIEGPKWWQYFMQCFRFLTAFALMTVAENRFPPLTACWNELEEDFMDDEIFDDGLFIQAWIFCDFPCASDDRTILDVFEAEFLQEPEKPYFTVFIDQMRASRFGVYQEVLRSDTTMRFRELITGNTVNTVRSIQDYEPGEVFLTRLVEYRGDMYHFGDPKCWPKTYATHVENFAREKLLGFHGTTITEKYHNFMRLAGPYWMSCVTSREDVPILPPNHYLHYWGEE